MKTCRGFLNAFYRTDSARDRSGFGLGLSIAKWIVELHRGVINVKSSLGHGTSFEIILPSRQNRSPAPRCRAPNACKNVIQPGA